MHRVASSLLCRSRAARSLSTSSKAGAPPVNERTALAIAASAVLTSSILASATKEHRAKVVSDTSRETSILSNFRLETISCDKALLDEDDVDDEQLMSLLEEDTEVRNESDVDIYVSEDAGLREGFTESIRFEQCIAYHRMLLPDYRQRWDYTNPSKQKIPPSDWPRHVPTVTEIPSMETDYSYCTRAVGKLAREMVRQRYCDNLMFRIAAFYLQQTESRELQRKGFKYVKELAERGHADGMCLYAMVLNDGRAPGVEANPGMATVWWRMAVDDHRHVASTYELAVAFFTGEGTAENEEMAVKYFRRAATLGHPGAAYMLGDCLLDGVGTRRDRAEALEWLVSAGELGHRGARSRVLAVLEMKEGEDYGKFTDSSRQTLVDAVSPAQDDEEKKWHHGEENEPALRAASIERRFTIGGGSRNPVVLARRKTVVAESRKS